MKDKIRGRLRGHGTGRVLLQP